MFLGQKPKSISPSPSPSGIEGDHVSQLLILVKQQAGNQGAQLMVTLGSNKWHGYQKVG